MYIGLGTILLTLACLAVGYSIAEGAANRRWGERREARKQRRERGLE